MAGNKRAQGASRTAQQQRRRGLAIKSLASLLVAVATGSAGVSTTAHHVLVAPLWAIPPASWALVQAWARAGVHFGAKYQDDPVLRLCLLCEVGLDLDYSAFVGWQCLAYKPFVFLLASAAYMAAYLLTAGFTIRRLQKVSQFRRGTEQVHEWPLGKQFVAWHAMLGPVLQKFSLRFAKPTPTKEISAFVVAIATSMSLALTASASASLSGLAHEFAKGSATSTAGVKAPGPTNSPKATQSNQEVKKTYEDYCGSTAPSAGAPAWAAEKLDPLWLGIHGAGATQGGCGTGGRPIDPAGTVWAVEGMCGDQLQSFGVASRKYGAALLYQQAATIAFQLATDGRLLGADSRVDVANGDYYVLHTVAGDYVLGRATKTILLRAPQPSPGAPACPGAKSTPLIDRVNAPYLTLVPAAASLWRSEIRRDQVWLWPLATRVATTFDLVTASGAPVVVATIRCTSAGAEASCTISRGSTRDR